MGQGDATPGPGHSFRSDREDAFASSRIRASIDSAPNAQDLEPTLDDDSGVEKNRNAAIVDEAMRQLQPFHLVEAELSDFDLYRQRGQ